MYSENDIVSPRCMSSCSCRQYSACDRQEENSDRHTCPHDPCDPPDLFTNRCKGQSLGMAYVPAQKWRGTFQCETGFQKGTVFPELVMPFHPQGGCPHE